jgi:hypothetical protein
MKQGYKINRRLTEVRNKMIYDCWENYKSEITMKEMVAILGAMPVTIAHLYLLIRKENEKRNLGK